ncbi:MAG: hypothetical protein PVH84_17515 [Candidatus Aminicenantes bacterium]|jgi:hypothetical protein
MGEEKKREKIPEENRDIIIDYENIDVADIMDQIKKKIAARPKRAPELSPVESTYTPYPTPPPEIPPEGSGAKTKIKALLLKIMKPFSPLIRLLVLPVSHELAETVKTLDRTNKRLDYLTEKLHHDLFQLNESLNSRIEVIDKATNKRLDLAFDDIGRIKEYTKLLHSLSHNVVVEMTKLKIEEENLRIKSRILEKNFEFLGQREKALEDQVLK